MAFISYAQSLCRSECRISRTSTGRSISTYLTPLTLTFGHRLTTSIWLLIAVCLEDQWASTKSTECFNSWPNVLLDESNWALLGQKFDWAKHIPSSWASDDRTMFAFLAQESARFWLAVCSCMSWWTVPQDSHVDLSYNGFWVDDPYGYWLFPTPSAFVVCAWSRLGRFLKAKWSVGTESY